MKKIILFLFTFFILIRLSGQGTDCSSAKPFCMGSAYIFPATTGVFNSSVDTYPNYGCLHTVPNPSWYYMRVEIPGNFVIHISTTQPHDIDFICWGPFSTPSSACIDSLLTGNCPLPIGCPNNTNDPTFYPSGNIIDCSYSTFSTEDCHINYTLTGQYYIILVTNYINIPSNIIFTQTNAGQPGAGTTSCCIVPVPIQSNGPLCVGETLELFTDTVPCATNYSWLGPNGWTSYLQNPIIPNVTPEMAGNYSCVVMGGGQVSVENSTNVIVNSTSPTTTGIISGKTHVNQGQNNVKYEVSAIPGADSYIWDLPLGVSGESNTNTIYVNFSNSAQSSVIKVKGHNNCGDGNYSSFNVFVHQYTGTGVVWGGDIIVFPNPASLSLTISYNLKNSQMFTLDVYDLTGRKVKELVNSNQHSGEHHLTLDTSELTQGVYLLKATGNDNFETVKFSVVH